MNLKVFAWDFHGTLERGVEVGFWHILKLIAKERGLRENFKLFEVRKLYGISVADYLRHFFPESSELTLRQMMAKVAEVQNQKYLKKFVSAAPRAIEVLTKIRDAGHKNIIVSNSHPKHIEPLVEIVGMKDLVDQIYAIDRHYAQEKVDPSLEKTKVMKTIILENNLGSGQLIAIGDKAIDVNAGIAAGAVTYQYIRPGFPTDKTDAKYKIHDLREVLREIYAD